MNIENMKSNLKMNNLYFKSLSFSRKSSIASGEVGIDVKRNIVNICEHQYRVELITNITKEDMNLNIVAEAEFIYDSDDIDNEENIISINTVAIMFPFVRSEVTLMTSQPGMTPIVLPTINTQKLV